MLSLIVVIFVCVLIYKEANNQQVNSLGYIIACILLGFVPSTLLHLLVGNSFFVVIISFVLTVTLCFIPLQRLKKQGENSSDELNAIVDE